MCGVVVGGWVGVLRCDGVVVVVRWRRAARASVFRRFVEAEARDFS